MENSMSEEGGRAATSGAERSARIRTHSKAPAGAFHAAHLSSPFFLPSSILKFGPSRFSHPGVASSSPAPSHVFFSLIFGQIAWLNGFADLTSPS